MIYAKLIDGEAILMTTPSNISINLSSNRFLSQYAAENGFKKLITSTPSTIYDIKSYNETDDEIIEIWSLPSLEDLKVIKKAEAEETKELALQTSAEVPVEDIGNVLYNNDALINVMGLLLAQAEESVFVLADDTVVTLTLADIQKISTVLSEYRASIYTIKSTKFALIDACEDINELVNL